ncbi:MAG: aminotransferase class I/II-fold pyridoxal phosphate-dependent enzyme [Rhodospirillaceae bacterium]|jgi:aspartate/methionine/tyrosine aminotransferase|nr:aminotransferase class I/II-fold pyridoxal phosphate-dependent enzyme [Rhodospirillaceae bacterium]MBT5014004.1 aminotransferase class I/II-fold pyridoxal phosphate-dependent enzyme [Rhodospirillaceae bacterium]MBT5309017.1 aminotransferase class I/II-fold pyridoxal phosphate-dependent enzyme [Rhodospirillaceae bacterium]MBT6406872.1 aminotransferase class I/II-fold pyridoxal phosphate-dependent enzyme [Rhodospirillaceae bacterium]MBT7355130.1 aminotransferase class I/II-fold pyridoxal phosp
MLKISKRGNVPAFIVMDVMRAANQRDLIKGDVLHLEVGQPGTPAPTGVLAAAHAALDDDRIGYTDAFGIPPLRERLVRHYKDAYGQEVSADRIIATTGSSGAFIVAFLAAFDSGDRVALASPGYPAYRNILRALDVEPVELLVGPQTNYQPTPEILDTVEGPLDGLIIASPSNPTGTMIPPDDLKSLAAYCRDRGLRLISDEIYHGITYGMRAQTALAYDDNAIVVNSFSKYFSMTGWRLGWMVVPEDMLRPLECLLQNLFISPPTLSQLAGVAAFDCRQELDGYVANYARNRALLLEELPKAGFTELSHADGAFYIYADVSHLTDDSHEFCRRILEETGVAVTPGSDFDPTRGSRTMRFSFAGPTDIMAEAAKRLKSLRL